MAHDMTHHGLTMATIFFLHPHYVLITEITDFITEGVDIYGIITAITDLIRKLRVCCGFVTEITVRYGLITAITGLGDVHRDSLSKEGGWASMVALSSATIQSAGVHMAMALCTELSELHCSIELTMPCSGKT